MQLSINRGWCYVAIFLWNTPQKYEHVILECKNLTSRVILTPLNVIATGPKVTLDHILVKTYPIFIQFEDYITREGYCNLGKFA